MEIRSLACSVADPYHLIRIRIQVLKLFVTDPDPDRILIRIQIRIQVKNDTGTDPDPGQKGFSNRTILNILYKKTIRICNTDGLGIRHLAGHCKWHPGVQLRFVKGMVPVPDPVRCVMLDPFNIFDQSPDSRSVSFLYKKDFWIRIWSMPLPVNMSSAPMSN